MQTGKENAALIVLSLMLTAVFAVSVWMYDGIETQINEGALSSAAQNVRDFIDENEFVAAFLGIDEDAGDKGTKEDTQSLSKDIEEEAQAYIERYNEIYENLK